MSDRTASGPTGPAEPGRRTDPSGRELASWGRRLLARVIDGIAGALVALAVLGPDGYNRDTWAPLLIFFVQTAFGTALVGGSFGQLVTRVRVLRLDGRPLSLGASLLRTLLICLVIPPLVFRSDGRGLHDLVTSSAAFRLRRT
ncbi:MAG: RDD family protein [Marmoricola sp.]